MYSLQLDALLRQYQSFNLHNVLDYDRFNQYLIIHHSTSIEGSTLTKIETQLLLEEDITPKGKPLMHSLMVKDHYGALQFILKSAATGESITVDFIQKINSLVMKNTGNVYNTVFGEIDASKGMFRKGNVSAGGSYFPNFNKVELLTTELASRLAEHIHAAKTTEEQLKLSFLAHFDLVSIHPFYDGNGRTSRLLMNFIQSFYGLPLGIVYLEDKADYYQALQDTRKVNNMDIFYRFMFGQYEKYLQSEVHTFLAGGLS